MSGKLLSTGIVERTCGSSKLAYSYGLRSGYDVTDNTRGFFLSVNLRSSETELAIATDALRRVFTPPGSTLLIPPGVDIREIDAGGSKDFFFLDFDKDAFTEDLSVLGASLTQYDLTKAMVDPAVHAFAKEVRRHLLSGEHEGSLFLEELTTLIFRRCLVVYGKTTRKQPDLTQYDFNRLVDFVETHLDQSLTIEDLSNVAGVPSRALSSAFQREAKQSVASFVLEKRIERARDMLVQTEAPISHIAYACGFSSQQHMTNSFTSKLGVTPLRYRREVR